MGKTIACPVWALAGLVCLAGCATTQPSRTSRAGATSRVAVAVDFAASPAGVLEAEAEYARIVAASLLEDAGNPRGVRVSVDVARNTGLIEITVKAPTRYQEADWCTRITQAYVGAAGRPGTRVVVEQPFPLPPSAPR